LISAFGEGIDHALQRAATDSRDGNRIFPATDGADAIERGRLPVELDQEAEIRKQEAEM